MWGRHHGGVPVGVVDVGSNTVRVVVKEDGRTVFTDREMLRLGADIERHGFIPAAQIEHASAVVRSYVEQAHRLGAEVEILITSPGRQAANGDELADALAEASGQPTRILSAAEEDDLRSSARSRRRFCRRAARSPSSTSAEDRPRSSSERGETAPSGLARSTSARSA